MFKAPSTNSTPSNVKIKPESSAFESPNFTSLFTPKKAFPSTPLKPKTPSVSSTFPLFIHPAISSNSIDYLNDTYFILSPIGNGDFASVFHIQHKQSLKYYALKKSNLKFSSIKDRTCKIQEAEIQIFLKSDFIVELIVAWEQLGFLYMVLELCDCDLSFFMKHTKSFDENFVWSLIAQLVEAVYHVHLKGVIHLDLKPANILTTRHRILIGDFGHACRLPVPLDREPEGDRTYIAPEILSNIYTTSADVFSIGLIILEIIAGVNLPPNGIFWHQIRSGIFDGMRFVSNDLEVLVKGMLHPDFEQRSRLEDVLKHPIISSVLQNVREQRSKIGGMVG